ncbi:MAG TPA: SDR family NAD(P)-dependent oxidoreductase [Mycobacteriales bacterium]|nr:SDR family NAD(P)-dependent oxidoreductase [Mycobacteriales bacterium]
MFISGASRGIGLAIAKRAAQDGANIALIAKTAEPHPKLEGTVYTAAKELEEAGGQALPIVGDVRDPESVESAVAQAVEQFGGIDIAVNNAGVVSMGNSWEVPLDEWHRIVDVNLWGVVHGVRAFVPVILRGGQPGHVVNTGSMTSVAPMAQIAPYSVTKHGVLALSDCLRAELAAIGAPVGVSVVMPGLIATALNPVGELPPTVVATNVVDAIRRDRHYVFTDHHFVDDVDVRLNAILAARADVI